MGVLWTRSGSQQCCKRWFIRGCKPRHDVCQLEMGDEIFTFESFINFMIFFKYFKTPFLKFSLKFCILIIIY